jgi:hypothetical protein
VFLLNLLQRESPFLARNGNADAVAACLLLRDQRTSPGRGSKSENDPGCVKTCTRRERAELFSLFSSSDGDWQIASFLIQRNRDKLSARKFDVGVFTQPGP